MKKQVIAVIYTSMGGLVGAMKKKLSEAFPSASIVNIADDSLIKEVIANGGVTSTVRERMMHYFEAASLLNPELIVCACSSVGEIAEEADGKFGSEVLRIDRAMIEKAIDTGKRIGVLASLETTLLPTKSFIERLAEQKGKEVEIIARVARGAYEANSKGHAEIHDQLILNEARCIASDVDVILLAQGSMERMEEPLRRETGLPVYSSPALCVQSIRERWDEKGEAI